MISTIIPTFNRAEYILEALDSVFLQSYRPIELIVIDDGSTDNTIELINTWQEEVKNDLAFTLKVVSQKNAGPSSARNTGIRETNGEFIHFLDSDDMIWPIDAYDWIIQEMQNKGLDLCQFGLAFWAEESNKIAKTYLPVEGSSLLSDFFSNHILGYGIGFIRSKELVERIGLWEETIDIGEDKEYCLRSILMSKHSGKINKVAYKVRQHEGSRLNSGRKTKNRWEKLLYVDKKQFETLSKNNREVPDRIWTQFATNLFNIGINMYYLGFNDLGREYGKLANNIHPRKKTRSLTRMKWIWFLGPTVSAIWVGLRKIKQKIQ